MSWMNAVDWPGWRGVIEIIIMFVMFYFFSRMFRGTRSTQVITGLIVVVIALLGITQLFHLMTLNFLLRQFFLYAALGVLIVFQPEIRRALAEIGRKPKFHSTSETRAMVDAVVQATVELSEQRIGVLIAIERDIQTRSIQETGILIDSRVNAELLMCIFFPHTPLHDGGIILSGNRIAAAGCLFPLSQRTEISRGLGTRHRAALGLTEETDAIVVIVSEETGTISVSSQGTLSRDFDAERLRRYLLSVLTKETISENLWQRLMKQWNIRLGGVSGTPQANGAKEVERER